MSRQPDDLELMRGIARRDVGALRSVFDRFAPLMLSVAQKLLVDQHEAEDCVQDVMLELWRNAKGYDATRGAPQTYVLLLTRSRALDRIRKNKRTVRVVEVHENLLEGAGADQRLETDEMRALVRKFLRSLPEQHRRALELSFFHGLSHQQIADHLNMPLGTVKGHIRNGLIRLRQALQRRAEGGAPHE
jgi:RNA polymerase sigma-70 factor (ECF subfamily)